MARHPRNELAVKDFHKNLTKAVSMSTADPIPKRIELWIHSTSGHHVAEESIRRALRGEIDPTGCNAELILGLAGYFEVSPRDLGKFAAERVEQVMVLAGAAGVTPPDGPDEQVIRHSWWIADRALQAAA